MSLGLFRQGKIIKKKKAFHGTDRFWGKMVNCSPFWQGGRFLYSFDIYTVWVSMSNVCVCVCVCRWNRNSAIGEDEEEGQHRPLDSPLDKSALLCIHWYCTLLHRSYCFLALNCRIGGYFHPELIWNKDFIRIASIFMSYWIRSISFS